MKFRCTVGVVCAVLMAAIVAARAEEKKDAQSKSAAKPAKLVLPWNKLSNLSDEQTTLLQPVEPGGHRAGGDQRRAGEVGGVHTLGAGLPAQRVEHVEVAEAQLERGQLPFDVPLQQPGESQ